MLDDIASLLDCLFDSLLYAIANLLDSVFNTISDLTKSFFSDR